MYINSKKTPVQCIRTEIVLSQKDYFLLKCNPKFIQIVLSTIRKNSNPTTKESKTGHCLSHNPLSRHLREKNKILKLKFTVYLCTESKYILKRFKFRNSYDILKKVHKK